MNERHRTFGETAPLGREALSGRVEAGNRTLTP
jgi:hypothetical protein